MVKIINGVAEKVLPWCSLASANGTVVFAPPEGKDYITREDICVTEEALDAFYTETADSCWELWTGSNFVITIHGADDDMLIFEDDDIVGLTLDEIADTIFEEAIEWFEACAIEDAGHSDD